MMLKGLQFLAYSNLWISSGAALFTLFFYWAKGVPVNLQLMSFVFCATLFTYTFQRFVKLKSNERISGPRMDWMQYNQNLIKLILIVGLMGTAFFAFFLSFSSILLLGALGIISILYAVKIELSKSKKKNLRDISGIKIFLIGIVWASSCMILPYINHGDFQLNIMLHAAACTIYIIGITIPFDIRDLEVDEVSKKTIPQVLGETISKWLGAGLILCAGMLLTFDSQISFYALSPGIVISALFVLTSSQRRNELYFSIVLDGLLILMPLSYYLLNSL